MQNIVKDNYVIDGSTVSAFTEMVNENVAMIESSSAIQKFDIKQILKATCMYTVKGEHESRGITVTVGTLNTLTNVLYTETNKIIPTNYVKGQDFTKDEIIEALTKEIDSYIAGYKIEANFNRAKKSSISKYELIFKE